MLIIEGTTKNKIKTSLFTTSKPFLIDSKENSIKIFLNNEKIEEISIKELFSKYEYIDRIKLNIYEDGTLLKNSIVYIRKVKD